MMYPRLVLLRELMREDGSLWISIDDNEVHNLRLLLDEIFGIENRLASIVWQKSDSPSSNVKNITFNVFHEYILAYAKKADAIIVPWRETPEILEAYPLKDDEGRPYRLRLLRKNGKAAKRSDRPSMWYKITDPDGKAVYPVAPEGWEGRWSVAESTFKQLAKDDEIRWLKREGKWTPYTVEKAPRDPRTPYPTIWTDVGQSRQAKSALTEILGNDVDFDTPKPVELLQQILQIATSPGDVVLDSFAGSGTTGHAVLEGYGDRKFILVQMAADTKEDKEAKRNICKEITSERVRRVAKEVADQSFTYARVGDPLFSEYRDFGERLPAWEELARYIVYTETSRDADVKKFNEKSGLIGTTDAGGGTSYYLLYTPNKKEDREMSLVTLRDLLKHDKNRNWVIYCEKVWLHQDQLRAFEKEHGKRIRPMLVPFNLK